METLEAIETNWQILMHDLGVKCAVNAATHDKDGTFVHENYAKLREHKFFSAMVPVELGGGGLSHADMCNLIRIMAHYCSSTALAFSMHQHLIAAAVWKYKNKNEGAEMLRNVAENELVLISTGARDWLGSNGELTKTEGGYFFSGKKHFASQATAGNVAVTSAQYQHPDEGWQVLHFAVPMKAEGISIADDWDVMGMRATGSQTIIFDDVFIPDTAISLARPKDEFHPIWSVVLTVALPLIMAAYVGIAERAIEIAIAKGKNYKRNEQHMAMMVGRINNSLVSAKSQWRAMYALTNNYDFKPDESVTIEILSLKTNVGDATQETVAKAMEALGGQSFYKSNVLERLFRDVQASPFHPLPKWDQYVFTGERLLAE